MERGKNSQEFKTPHQSFVNWNWSIWSSTSEKDRFLSSGETNPNHNNQHMYNPLQTPQTPYLDSSRINNDDNLLKAKQLKRNFLLFSFFYSIIHAAVDCVIAFSSAELGTTLGSYGGFTLYIFYTISSLFFAKPLLSFFSSSKILVALGLLGLFCYVIGFYLAIIFIPYKYEFFLIGAGIGGLGAGVLWTSQGVYYTLNAKLFSYYRNENKLTIIYQFAAIFAIFYLLFEAVLQFISTAIFYIFQQASKNDNDDNTLQSWRPVVFGVYSLVAAISLLCFWIMVLDFKDEEDQEHRQDEDHSYNHIRSSEIDDLIDDEYEQIYFRSNHLSTHNNSHHRDSRSKENRDISHSSHSSSFRSSSSNPQQEVIKPSFCSFQRDVPTTMVGHVFAICFGLSAGLVQTYVNGVIVKDNLGDGYIGFLAGIITLVAVIIAKPLEWITNRYQKGKLGIMISGGLCFVMGGLLLLCFSDQFLSQWGMIVMYYILHGIARGIWENTNKAVIAEFFTQAHERDVAFASIYFASGFSGALGFLFFQFLSKNVIAIINVVISSLAIVGYYWAQQLHDREMREETLTNIHHLTDAGSRSSSSSSLDEMTK